MGGMFTTYNITHEEACYMNIALNSKLIISKAMQASLTTSEMRNIIHVESGAY